MAKRLCIQCNKEKDLTGGRVCENGHFICAQCVHGEGLAILGPSLVSCPLCGKKLR